MAKFEFIQDIKVSVWQRQRFYVDAENEEDAINKAKEFSDDDVSAYDNYIGSEMLYETEETMSVNDNHGDATIEVYSENDLTTPIITNK